MSELKYWLITVEPVLVKYVRAIPWEVFLALKEGRQRAL